MSRFKAFSIHFGISLAIFSVLAWLVVNAWYPDFFFETDGGWEGIRIIVLVDLVLGPLLTLIVFKAGKPGLAFDMSVIALLQILALGAGTWIVLDQRPLALVLVDGQFHSVSADDFAEVGLETPDFDRFEGPYPKWLTVALPDDVGAEADLRGSMFRSGRPLRLVAERYVPYTRDHLPADESMPLLELRRKDIHHEIDRWEQRHGVSAADCLFFRYGARYRYEFLGFDAASRRLIGLLSVPALDPPAESSDPRPDA